jgi:hypothetical protein
VINRRLFGFGQCDTMPDSVRGHMIAGCVGWQAAGVSFVSIVGVLAQAAGAAKRPAERLESAKLRAGG